MRLTLRLIIGVMCAVIVAVVAAVTLSITLTVSLATIRDLGRQHSRALATNARNLVAAYFDEPARRLDAFSTLFLSYGLDLPSALPDQTLDEPKRRLMDALWLETAAVNHSYATLGVIFEDGSGCSTYKIYGGQYMHGMCRFAHEWPHGGNQSILLRNWRLPRGDEVDIYYNDTYNLDSRFAAYYSARLLMSGVAGEPGLWFPVTLFEQGADSKFMWPATKPLYNASGGYIGIVSIGQSIADIADMLQAVRATPNTEAFAVQNDGFLVGSTHPTPFFTFENVSVSAPTPIGCASAGDTTFNSFDSATTVHGCRTRASDFPFAPLQEAASDRGFLSTAGSQEKYVKVGGEPYFIASVEVPNPYRSWGLNIVLCMPEADILGDIVRGRNMAIGVTVAVFVVAAVISFVLVYVLLQPLSEVSRRMLDTAKLREPEGSLKYSSLAEIGDLQRAHTNMNMAIRSFTRYVPREVVKDLMASGQLCTIQMSPMMCSMLFVDIAGFTTICERVPPEVLSNLVSEYFDRASRIVMEHDGVIDKFIGDCIMAVWGAPFAISNHEVKSTLAGVLLNRETAVAPLSQVWDEAGEVLQVRVGVSSGEVLAGNMGSADRMNYTVIGDPVNLAARLESLNKQFDTRVMISEMTAEGLGSAFVLRLLAPIAVVGKEKPVKVYEVLGLTGTVSVEDANCFDVGDATAAQSHASFALNGSFSSEQLSNSGSFSMSMSASGYGTTSVYRKSKKLTVAMLRDAITRTATSEFSIVSTPEEVDFAQKHTAAVHAYLSKDFAGAIAQFDGLLGSQTVQSFSEARCRPERSVRVIRELCEKCLRDGVPADFDGVFRAAEK